VFLSQEELIRNRIVDAISDIILEFIEEDDLTGRLIEEAILEALQDNASYFSGRAEKSNQLVQAFLTSRLNENSGKEFECSSECDI